MVFFRRQFAFVSRKPKSLHDSLMIGFGSLTSLCRFVDSVPQWASESPPVDVMNRCISFFVRIVRIVEDNTKHKRLN